MNISHKLNPKKILIDDRSFSDLIVYIRNLSKKILYYNSKNEKDGSFSSVIDKNHSFLTAEISKFEILKYGEKRLLLVKKFDNVREKSKKIEILNDYVELTNELLIILNKWYLKSRLCDVNNNSDNIENELENTIINEVSSQFNSYQVLLRELVNENLIKTNNNINSKDFSSIVWKNKKFEELKFKNIDAEILLNNALKQVILISNKIYETIYKITIKSSKFFKKNIENNKSHNAHVGLILSFLKLFENLQNDINSITEKHLNYYYKEILKQSKVKSDRTKTFVNFEIDENFEKIPIKTSDKLIAGQYDDGSNIYFNPNYDIELNNIKISSIMTIYLSQNSIFEFNSRYQLVSSIFSKEIAKNITDVENFNNNNLNFSTLGDDQNFLTPDENTMDYADVGFIISSPVLKLSQSNRTIDIDFYFDIESIKYLSDLLIDISNNTDLSDDEIFYKVFSESFIVSYSSDEGWEEISEYEFLLPKDWSLRKLSIQIKLNKLKPSFKDYDEEIHGMEIVATNPLIKFKLNQEKFYNAFSFLNTMNLEKIEINVNVKNLKKINAFRDGDLISLNSDFELFGPVAKQKSKIYIACEEIFNKKLSNFTINWDYSNLNEIENDFENHYAGYKKEIKNESFKIKLCALSDFNYFEHSDQSLIFNLFDDIKNENSSFKIDDISNLKINPNYSLTNQQINEFSNDLETGILKIELIEPKMGFGYDIYPKIYANQVSENANPNSKKNDIGINEPFCPRVSNLYINYNAYSKLIFKENERMDNDFEENNNFFLITPTGTKKTFSKNSISNSIIHNFNNEGELILGLESSSQIQELNLLFEIEKNENTDYKFSRNIEWEYSSFENWKKLEIENILFDETQSLVKSGVISFKFPVDFTNNQTYMKDNKYYIRVSSKHKADQFGLVKSILTNSVSVTELDASNGNRIDFIKANTIEGFENKIDGLITVNQPFDSIKAEPIESDMDFYLRTSELLRHKKRPINNWDFEKFIRNKYKWISFVKCYSENSNIIKILCFKKIQKFQNIEEVKLSAAEIIEIKDFVKKHSSPFVKIEIENPVFEDLWIKGKIIFLNISNGNGIKKLNNDLLNFICPWKNNQDFHGINNILKKIDIINFIKERKYVSFITGFSIIHLKRFDDGSIEAYDSANTNDEIDFIKSGSQKSIIVPRDNNMLTIIKEKEYYPPEPVKFEELRINKSFLVEKKPKHKKIRNKRFSQIKNNDNTQFVIKL